MIKLALADDHNLMRSGIAALLRKEKDFELLFEACNGQDLLDQLKVCQTLPDIILMDLQMPVLDGGAATKIISKTYPFIKVIILSFYHHEHLVLELLHYNAKGFVSKRTEPEELIHAIKTVYDNQLYIEQGLLHDTIEIGIAKNLILSNQQKSFLKYCAIDYTYKEIAVKMNLSVRTVQDHRDRLFEKLNVNTRVGLLLYAIQTGVVDVLNMGK